VREQGTLDKRQHLLLLCECVSVGRNHIAIDNGLNAQTGPARGFGTPSDPAYLFAIHDPGGFD